MDPISAGINKKKDDEPNASGRTSGIIYQSTIGISAGANKRKMKNLMPPAGLAGPVPLMYYKVKNNFNALIFFLFLY